MDGWLWLMVSGFDLEGIVVGGFVGGWVDWDC